MVTMRPSLILLCMGVISIIIVSGFIRIGTLVIVFFCSNEIRHYCGFPLNTPNSPLTLLIVECNDHDPGDPDNIARDIGQPESRFIICMEEYVVFYFLTLFIHFFLNSAISRFFFILEPARRKKFGKVSHNNKKAADRQSRKAKQSSDKGRKTSRRSFKKWKKAFKKIKSRRVSGQIRTKKGGKGSSTRNISN